MPLQAKTRLARLWKSSRRFVWTGIVVIVVGWLMSTRGGIGEFSPYTLEHRWRSEYTLFFGEIPIYRSRWHYETHPLTAYLQAEGLVSAVHDESQQRWELLFHWNGAWKDGYGGLYDEFRGAESTIEWCEANPTCARLYYSELFKLLRSDLTIDHWMAHSMRHLARNFTDEHLESMKRLLVEYRADMLKYEIRAIDHGVRVVSTEVEAQLRKELALAQSQLDEE